MKNTLACPKCRARKLWRIEKVHAPDSKYKYGSGGMPFLLAQGRHEAPAADKRPGFLGDFLTPNRQYWAGHVDAYVCASCGFTEFWAREDLAELRHNPADGVHFIDASPEQGGYR